MFLSHRACEGSTDKRLIQTCLCLTDLSTGESNRGFRPCLILLTGGYGNEGVACSGLLKAGPGSALSRSA
jgi:hypothetical protein